MAQMAYMLVKVEKENEALKQPLTICTVFSLQMTRFYGLITKGTRVCEREIKGGI